MQYLTVCVVALCLLANCFAGPNTYNCKKKAFGKHGVSGNCSAFYFCDGRDSDVVEQSCESGLNFNIITKECAKPQDVDCDLIKSINETFCLKKSGGLYENDKNCYLYYDCFFYITYVMSCPGDLVFNSDIKVCDYVESVPRCWNLRNAEFD